MDPYILQGIRKFPENDYLNDDEVEAENRRVLSNIPVKTFGITRNAESVQNFQNAATGGKRLPQSSTAGQQFSGKRLPALTIPAKRLPHQPPPQHSNTFGNHIISTRSSSLAIDKMPSDSQSNMSMGGLERISITHSKTHPRMPLPPASLLQTDPLKYLKTYLVLIRPSRMRESEMDYSILESNPLITVLHLKQAIVWISPKLIAIMNENAELERQVKNLGPRRTKVLGADVYQPITQFKMRREEWRGTDFAYCLKEATRRLPKEEIKNTRFLARLQRNPLNGQAANCAEQTMKELGLSMPEWINARCVASDGSRMDLFCEPVESTAIRDHAVALNSEPSSSSSSSSSTHALPSTSTIPTNTKRSRAKLKAGGAAASVTKPNSNSDATSSRQTKEGNKKRNYVAAHLDDEEHAGDSGDHTSDSDFAQQPPPRKKTKTSTPGKPYHATKKRAAAGGRHSTAATSNSHPGSGAYAHHHTRRRKQTGSYDNDAEHEDEEGDGHDDENEGYFGGRDSRGVRAATPTTTHQQQQHNHHNHHNHHRRRSSNVNVCPSTPAGKMIQVKDEIYSS